MISMSMYKELSRSADSNVVKMKGVGVFPDTTPGRLWRFLCKAGYATLAKSNYCTNVYEANLHGSSYVYRKRYELIVRRKELSRMAVKLGKFDLASEVLRSLSNKSGLFLAEPLSSYYLGHTFTLYKADDSIRKSTLYTLRCGYNLVEGFYVLSHGSISYTLICPSHTYDLIKIDNRITDLMGDSFNSIIAGILTKNYPSIIGTTVLPNLFTEERELR